MRLAGDSLLSMCDSHDALSERGKQLNKQSFINNHTTFIYYNYLTVVMDKAVLTIPIIMTLVLGAVTQLEQIAQSSADKAVAFSDDMNSAMDCATKGIPIKECSPELLNHDFEQEREAFEQVLQELENETIDY